MTSQNSLIPSPPERSELEARVEQALKVAREAEALIIMRHADPWVTSAKLGDAIEQIIRILEDGRP